MLSHFHKNSCNICYYLNSQTIVDGQLFEIKHLLILREQIAPFQVDFSVKEMSLDFSRVKVAGNLLNNVNKSVSSTDYQMSKFCFSILRLPIIILIFLIVLALSLLQKKKQLFSLNGNNSLLEFIVDGTPQVKEYFLDSKKEVDKQLKGTCEHFILHCTQILIGPLKTFLTKVRSENMTPTPRISQVYGLLNTICITPLILILLQNNCRWYI